MEALLRDDALREAELREMAFPSGAWERDERDKAQGRQRLFVAHRLPKYRGKLPDYNPQQEDRVIYFIPYLRMADSLDKQKGLVDKFGGVPWGLPQHLWPICKSCKKPMVHLAQFIHHPRRLDLGLDGRSLLVFQCGAECATWEMDGGCNACIILEPEEFVDGLTPPPKVNLADWSQDIAIDWQDYHVILPDFRVTAWIEQDDQVTQEQELLFFNANAIAKIPDELEILAYSETKLGGVPAWLQGLEKGIDQEWKLAAQMSDYIQYFVEDHKIKSLDFLEGNQLRKLVSNKIREMKSLYQASGSPFALIFGEEGPDREAFIDKIMRVLERDSVRQELAAGNIRVLLYPESFDRDSEPDVFQRFQLENGLSDLKKCLPGPNFGDAGIGYILIARHPKKGKPEAKFLWQCH